MTGISAFRNSCECSWRQHNGLPNSQNAYLARPSGSRWGKGIIRGTLISYRHYSMSWQLALRNDAGRLYHKRQGNECLSWRHTLFISHQWSLVPPSNQLMAGFTEWLACGSVRAHGPNSTCHLYLCDSGFPYFKWLFKKKKV